MENAGVNCMEHQTKIVLRKSLSYIELENAGADRTAYKAATGKCRSRFHGLGGPYMTRSGKCRSMQIVRPIKLQPENTGAYFMAYMTRSRKCESTSHGLHQYTNKNHPKRGVVMVNIIIIIKFLFSPKRWRRRPI